MGCDLGIEIFLKLSTKGFHSEKIFLFQLKCVSEFELREGAMRIHGKFGVKNRIRGRQRRERESTCLLTENPALGKQKGERAMGFSALKRCSNMGHSTAMPFAVTLKCCAHPVGCKDKK